MASILSHSRATLAAVAGRSAERTNAVAARHGAPHAFVGYEAMIDSGEVDAIIIIAPDALHRPIAEAAMDKGIHVMCEKPLASTGEDAEAMYRRAQVSGVVNMSFFATRALTHFRYIKKLVDDGFVGRVHSAHFSAAHGMFRGREYQWRLDAGLGKGALGDLGCYLIDQARWLIGEIGSVTGDLRSFISRQRADGRAFEPANDSAVFLGRFVSGAQATFTANLITHQPERFQQNVVVLQGDAGTLELNHSFSTSTIMGARAGDERVQEIEIPREFWGEVDPARPFEVMTHDSVGGRAFVDAIINGTAVEPDFHDGWRVQQVIDAVFSASESGAWTDVQEAVR